MSSRSVTFYPRPLICTVTYLSKQLFSEIIGPFEGVLIRLFRSLDQNGCNTHIRRVAEIQIFEKLTSSS